MLRNEIAMWLLSWYVKLAPLSWSRALALRVHARTCAKDRHWLQRPRLERNIAGNPKIEGHVSRCGLCGRLEMPSGDFAKCVQRG